MHLKRLARISPSVPLATSLGNHLTMVGYCISCINSHHQQAIAYKRQHPEASYAPVAARFGISASTPCDHVKGTHSGAGMGTIQNLSVVQENALVDLINGNEDKGVLLLPADIRQCAEGL